MSRSYQNPEHGGHASGDTPASELPLLPGLPRRLPLYEVRSLLRECVTVVGPGETLVIRAHDDWTAVQVYEIQQALNALREDWDLPFRAIVVPGAELGVASSKHAAVHQFPPEGATGVMPCCGKTVPEVPFWDRVALRDDQVTCKGAERSDE